MVDSLEDATHGFLLWSATPLVVAPPGLLPPHGTRLRGVVRASQTRARVVLSDDKRMVSGLAVEFALSSGGESLDVEAAIDFVRTTVAANIDQLRSTSLHHRDSHGNTIIEASTIGFPEATPSAFYDHSLFRLFGLLTHGGGFPWFEEVYTFAGFMVCANKKCRIYIKVTDSGQTYGIEIPLTHPDGTTMRGFGGSLPQELAPLVRNGDLFIQPQVADRDDYCAAVFDMTKWVDPTASTRAPRSSGDGQRQ